MDDHKYSVGRVVVFRLPDAPGTAPSRWAGKGSGTVIAVRPESKPSPRWVYTIERQRTRERVVVPEEDVLYGVTGLRGRGRRDSSISKLDRGEQIAGMLDRIASDSALADFLRTTVRDLVKKEESEEAARREGAELPIKEGDYVRIRGDLRRELEPFHNYYGKIIDTLEPDIAALEGAYKEGRTELRRVLRKYRVFLDEGNLVEVYDPEIKLYYTSHGRATILNWRAATFLAEAFGDDPPYNTEFSYLEDHVFTRDELKDVPAEELAHMLASILYVKGHMGWRDYEMRHNVTGLPVPYLVDSILAASRFDQRRNRSMTADEIDERRRKSLEFKRLIGR